MSIADALVVLGSGTLAIGLLQHLPRVDPVAQATDRRWAVAAARLRRTRRAWVRAGLVLIGAGAALLWVGAQLS